MLGIVLYINIITAKINSSEKVYLNRFQIILYKSGAPKNLKRTFPIFCPKINNTNVDSIKNINETVKVKESSILFAKLLDSCFMYILLIPIINELIALDTGKRVAKIPLNDTNVFFDIVAFSIISCNKSKIAVGRKLYRILKKRLSSSLEDLIIVKTNTIKGKKAKTTKKDVCAESIDILTSANLFKNFFINNLNLF